MDLIKSVWLNEPSILMGIASGKVVVSTYVADPRGRIPSAPRQVFRKNDGVAELPVVDVDGDGLPDLELGFTQKDSRDSLMKQITTKELDYRLRFYFNRGESGFPKEADCQCDVELHLDRTELRLGLGHRDYFVRSVMLEGDFNGDGKKDLLVRDRSDGFSIYYFISRQAGFSTKPDLSLNCPGEIDEWEITDLNNDGASDLIVKLAQGNLWRIFLSQK